MRISSDGLPFILPPAVIASALAAVGQPVLALVTTLATLLLVAFFRDPDRQCDAPADHVISPADGHVLFARRDPDGALRIAIFLSLFDVHVARAPVAGALASCERVAGGYAAANADRATDNARVLMRIEGSPSVDLSLMAGLVARRVLPWVAAPSTLRRGQRVAIIRFGSRAEIVLPASYEPLVQSEQRVRAGETVVAAPSVSSRD